MRTLRFSNELNKTLGRLCARELDIFIVVCYLYQTSIPPVIINYSEIRNILNMKGSSNQSIYKIIELSSKKVASILSGTEEPFFVLNAFNAKSFSISIDKRYEQFLSVQESNRKYMTIRLDELLEIKSKHTKHMYCMLGQFRSTGMVIIRYKDFIDRLAVPTKYSFKEVRANIIDPAMKVLKKYFINLHLDEEKSKERAAPNNTLYFYFNKEATQKKKEISDSTQTTSPKKEKKQKPKQSRGMLYEFEQNQYDFNILEQQLNECDRKKLMTEPAGESVDSHSIGGIGYE